MSEGDRYQFGVEVAQRLWGKERAGKIERSLAGFSPEFQRLVMETLGIYAQPPLEPKVRSLCTVAALTVLGRAAELRLHIVGALSNGASQEEIKAVLYQMAFYGGVPAAIEAFVVANKVFERHAAGKGEG